MSYVEPSIGLPVYSSYFDNAELRLERWSRFRQFHHLRNLQSLASLQEIGFDWCVIGNELVRLFHEALNLGPVEYLEAKVHPRFLNVNLITSNETLGTRIEKSAQQVACSVHTHYTVPSIPVYSTSDRLSKGKASGEF